MAVTSSFSAEIVAHASIATYDIYQPYINPKATDKQFRLVPHLSLVGFAIFSSPFAIAPNSSGVSMGWTLEFLGVFPITFAVASSHASPTFMTYAPPIGTIHALASWLGTAKGMYGTINISTTYENWPMFAGCLVDLMIPLMIWVCMRPFTKGYD